MLFFRTIFFTILGAASLTEAASAQSAGDFYKGKTLQFVVRSTPGSDYDSLSRLLARHMPHFVPGSPAAVVVNMPGAGGMRAANFLANIAPKDGTALSIVGQGLPANQGLGQAEGLRADLREFNWIGNVTSINQLLIVWHTSPVRKIDEIKTRRTVIGSQGGGSISLQIPAALNNLLGMKFDIVTGYQGLSEMLLALERGEVEAIAATTANSLRSSNPTWLIENKVIVLAQIGGKRSREFPDAPLIHELADKADDRSALEYISKGVSVGRPLSTTPGVSKERVAALRNAFNATVIDSGFLAEAKRQSLEIEPTDWESLKALVDGLIDSPKSLLEKVNAAIDFKGK